LVLGRIASAAAWDPQRFEADRKPGHGPGCARVGRDSLWAGSGRPAFRANEVQRQRHQDAGAASRGGPWRAPR